MQCVLLMDPSAWLNRMNEVLLLGHLAQAFGFPSSSLSSLSLNPTCGHTAACSCLAGGLGGSLSLSLSGRGVAVCDNLFHLFLVSQ